MFQRTLPETEAGFRRTRAATDSTIGGTEAQSVICDASLPLSTQGGHRAGWKTIRKPDTQLGWAPAVLRMSVIRPSRTTSPEQTFGQDCLMTSTG